MPTVCRPMLVFHDRRIASRLPPAPPHTQRPLQGRQTSAAAATALPAEHLSHSSEEIPGSSAGGDLSFFAGSAAALSLQGGRRQGNFSARPGCGYSAHDPGMWARPGAGPLGWPAAQHYAAAAAAAGAAARPTFDWASLERASPLDAAAGGRIGLRAFDWANMGTTTPSAAAAGGSTGSDSALSPRIFGARPAAESSCSEPQDARAAAVRPTASCPDPDPFRGDWPHW